MNEAMIDGSQTEGRGETEEQPVKYEQIKSKKDNYKNNFHI